MTIEMEHTFEPLYIMEYDGWIPVAEIDQFGNATISYKLERFEVQLYSHFMKPKVPITQTTIEAPTYPQTIPKSNSQSKQSSSGIGDPLDRISGLGPLERISTEKDPLDRLTIEDLT